LVLARLRASSPYLGTPAVASLFSGLRAVLDADASVLRDWAQRAHRWAPRGRSSVARCYPYWLERFPPARASTGKPRVPFVAANSRERGPRTAVAQDAMAAMVGAKGPARGFPAGHCNIAMARCNYEIAPPFCAVPRGRKSLQFRRMVGDPRHGIRVAKVVVAPVHAEVRP
jgi:hypothetical protein